MKNTTTETAGVQKKQVTVAEIAANMDSRIAGMKAELESYRNDEKYRETDFEGSSLFKKEHKRNNLAFFIQFGDKVEVIDENRLRFKKGIIYPKSLKVKFDGNTKIYTYGKEKIKQLLA